MGEDCHPAAGEVTANQEVPGEKVSHPSLLICPGRPHLASGHQLSPALGI